MIFYCAIFELEIDPKQLAVSFCKDISLTNKKHKGDISYSFKINFQANAKVIKA